MPYNTMTLPQLIEKITWQAEHAKDIRINANEIVLTANDKGGLEILLGNENMRPEPTHEFLGQLRAKINDAYKFDFRAGYWDACKNQTVPINGKEVNLLSLQANHWLGKMESRHLVRTFADDDNKPVLARAFLSDRYRRIDNRDLLIGIMPELRKLQEFGDFKVQACNVDDDGGRFYLKFSCPNRTRTIIKPDGTHGRGADRIHEVIEFGAEIGNSETGDRSYYCVPWSLVQWCRNGACHVEYGIRKNHVGRRIEEDDESAFSEATIRLDDQALLAKFCDIVRKTLSDEIMDKIAADVSKSMGIEVKLPSKAVEYLKSKYQLTGEEHDAVLNAFAAGVPHFGNSLWGLSNAVTAVAQDANIIDNFERASELEKIGGAIQKMGQADLRELLKV